MSVKGAIEFVRPIGITTTFVEPIVDADQALSISFVANSVMG